MTQMTEASQNANKYLFADFTRTNYRRLLRLAKANFQFRLYNDEEITQPKTLLWRHDLDFSVHSALKLARIEHEESVQSTYFLLLHSEFYNLLEKNITKLVREIISLGHDIALHFDTHFYDIQNEFTLQKWLTIEKKILEELFEHPINTFSFHITDTFTNQCRLERYAEMTNTYSDYFRENFRYCSDSNGYWRFDRLEDVILQSEKCLQVLTHPEYWQDQAMSPYERVKRCIQGRAKRTQEWYDKLLTRNGRLNIK